MELDRKSLQIPEINLAQQSQTMSIRKTTVLPINFSAAC